MDLYIFRWLVNGIVVDDQYEHNAGDVIENRLLWPSIGRKDLDALFTCQAINTKLTDPKESVVVLDLVCTYCHIFLFSFTLLFR